MTTPLLPPPASPKLSLGARVAQQLPGSLQGTVIDPAGMAVSEAKIYAIPEEQSNRQIQTTADPQGRFVFKGLPTGQIHLYAFRKTDGFPWNFFAFFNQILQSISTIDVKAGAVSPEIVINLGSHLARLAIDVIDEKGTPVRKPMRLIFTRDDIPGDYRQVATPPYSMVVPCVHFSFSVEVEGYQLSRSERTLVQPGDTLETAVKLHAQ